MRIFYSCNTKGRFTSRSEVRDVQRSKEDRKLEGEPKGKALRDGQDPEVYSSFTLTPCYSCPISNIKF